VRNVERVNGLEILLERAVKRLKAKPDMMPSEKSVLSRAHHYWYVGIPVRRVVKATSPSPVVEMGEGRIERRLILDSIRTLNHHSREVAIRRPPYPL
jgi:hypothetical protein